MAYRVQTKDQPKLAQPTSAGDFEVPEEMHSYLRGKSILVFNGLVKFSTLFQANFIKAHLAQAIVNVSYLLRMLRLI